jgi:hypothetical protein
VYLLATLCGLQGLKSAAVCLRILTTFVPFMLQVVTRWLIDCEKHCQHISVNDVLVHGDRKISQPILQFIDCCNLIQLDWFNGHFVSRWQYKILLRPRDLLAPVRQLSCAVDVQECLFQKRSECSLWNTNWHFVLNCRTELRDAFSDSSEPNRQYLVWWTVFITQELFIKLHQTWQEEKSECMHGWTRCTFPTLSIILVFIFYLCNLFFWQIERVSGMGCVTFRSPYSRRTYLFGFSLLLINFAPRLSGMCP